MTKTVKKLLICLMALAMTVCSGIALLGLNTTVAKAESTYDISILGTALSDSDLTFDSSDNASVTGSVTYSPEESKLTFNNFVFNGPTGVDVINVVVSTSKNLTIELIGDSEITITENTSPSKSPAAFYFKDSVPGEIRFVGGGSFTVDNAGIKSGRAAFYAYYKNIFVYNCQLTGKGYNTGIQYYDSIAAYGENASILATATNPYSERPSYSSSNLYIYPALAPMGGYMYSKRSTQKVEVSFNIDGSDPSTSVDTSNKGIYASYKYFHITPATVTVSASRPNEIGTYYNFSPSSLTYGEKITVTPAPGYVLTGIKYDYDSLSPAYSLQPDGSYVLDTADSSNTGYNTIKFRANYAEAKTITKTPSVGGDYVVPSAGAYNNVVTITPKPNAGYCTDTVTVTQANGNPITVTGPDADGAYTFTMPDDDVTIAVEFKELTIYDVWVAGIRLDSRNLTIDSNDNSSIEGSATYDAENNILTLDNFSYSGADYYLYEIGQEDEEDDYYYYSHASIYCKGDLNIVLNGENTLNCEITAAENYLDLINAEGALTISGGILNATVIQGNAIVANTLTMDNATFNSNSTYVSIDVDEDATISNSKVFAKGGSPVIKIKENKKLNITNSTFVIQSEDSYYGFYYNCVINIDENSVLEISVENTAITNGITVNYSQNSAVYAGENKENAQLVAEPDNTTFASKYLKIAPTSKVTVNYGISELANKEISIVKGETLSLETPEINGYALIGWYNEDTFETAFDFSTPITEDITIYAKWVVAYDIWVAGIRLNAENFTIDSEDNDAVIGSATYDPTSNTLTLDNFSYTGAGYLYEITNNSDYDEYYHYYAGVYSKGDLNIALNGENTLNCEIADEDSDKIYKYCKGINVDGALTISGGTLNATVIKGNAIVAKTLTIDNATLNSISTSANIYLYGDAIISNSKVFAKGGSPVIAIEPDDELKITNSTVVIQGEDSNCGIFYASAINIDENSVLEISVGNCAIQNEITVNYSQNSAVYAGENKENAQLVAEPDNTTFASKYLKIAPTSKVTVNYGISELANKEISIVKGETLSLETPEINGYALIGWYNEDTFETAFDFSTPITEDIIIYAKLVVAYDVWVAGIRLNAENFTIDSNDNSAITGKATYDAENNILTLDNFSYTGAGYLFDDWIGNSAIIFDKNELTVKLVGTNVITTTEDRCFGIVSYGLLTITDDTEDKTDGVLTITCEFCAINVGTLSISNVTVNATGLGAICVEDGDTIINNAIINAIGTSEQALLVYDRFNVENSSLTLESQVGTALDCYDEDDSYYTINNSTLTINSQNKGIRCAHITVSNSTIEISAVNEAICDSLDDGGCKPWFVDSHAVYAGDDSASATLIAESDDTTYENKYVKIVPAYDIWVAGIRLNAENFIIDRNDDSTITGSATYDPISNTLTLDNFVYTGAGYNYTGTNANALIYSTGIDLKIVLKGTNKLVGLVDVLEGIVINNGNLTIAGSDEYSDTASLELTAEDQCIYADGSLSIENVKLTTTTTALPTSSTTVAIYTDGDISIKGSEVTVIAGDSDGDGIIEYGCTLGIISYGNVTITDSSVNVVANGVGIDADSRMTIDNSTIIIDGGECGTSATDTSIKNSTVKISGEIAIETNTTYGGNLMISNSNVEMSAQKYAVHDLYYNRALDGYRLRNFTGVIYAGENKESATMLTEQDDIFANKYLRFAPASIVTVNYGISELANKEITIEKGTTISLETPVIADYVFVGWYNENTFETAFDFSTPITENITIYAKFANYSSDIENINGQISSVQSSISTLESNLANKADVTTLTDNVTDLQNQINTLTSNYQSADATQQAKIDALESQVENLIANTIAELTNRVTDIESKIANINDAISSNESDITENADKITSLTTQLTALQSLVNSLGDTYIDNDELAKLKTELAGVDSEIKGLIETLTAKVTDIESEIANINSAISSNESDIVANADKITSLTTQLTALQSLVNSLGDTYIDNDELAKLKTELAGVDSEIKGLIETLTAKVTDIESKIANINGAVSTNASDITENADKITSLTTQLTALQGAVDALDDAYIDNDELSSLKDALELADKGLNDLITALTTRVDKTESDIASLVSNKADVTLVTEKVEELKGLINSLDAVKNNYLTADEELKKNLESQIADAKTYALNTATELVNNAKTELNAAIALKADTATVTEKFAEVESAIVILQDLSDDYLSADEALKTELTTLINNTKSEIVELILAGDKANADALEEEVAKLRAEIEALKKATSKDVKEAEARAKVLPTILACIALAGNIALFVWLIIKRKIVK